jgi:hypothetical protein
MHDTADTPKSINLSAAKENLQMLAAASQELRKVITDNFSFEECLPLTQKAQKRAELLEKPMRRPRARTEEKRGNNASPSPGSGVA